MVGRVLRKGLVASEVRPDLFEVLQVRREKWEEFWHPTVYGCPEVFFECVQNSVELFADLKSHYARRVNLNTLVFGIRRGYLILGNLWKKDVVDQLPLPIYSFKDSELRCLEVQTFVTILLR